MINPSIYFSIRTWLRGRFLDAIGTIAKPAPGIHILNGHRTEEEQEPETFRLLLKNLSLHVKFIRIEEAINMIKTHQHPDVPLVAFTFDDGFMECYDVFAPVLEEFDTNALFFINPNYVEGDNEYIKQFNDHTVFTPNRQPMRWHHLKELSDRGFVIGAHTMDHQMICGQNDDLLHYQICECKTTIEQQLGITCENFAFPYGKLSHADIKSIDLACQTYKNVFSQSDYKHYFSFNNRVINRRHFEPFWSIKHVKYFLSTHKR